MKFKAEYPTAMARIPPQARFQLRHNFLVQEKKIREGVVCLWGRLSMTLLISMTHGMPSMFRSYLSIHALSTDLPTYLPSCYRCRSLQCRRSFPRQRCAQCWRRRNKGPRCPRGPMSYRRSSKEADFVYHQAFLLSCRRWAEGPCSSPIGDIGASNKLAFINVVVQSDYDYIKLGES